ncbi:MAG: T9SS type A sorting domain-containing protein, partial [bacterium]
DMYFSDLTGVWDGDKDRLWGEMPEYGDTADCFPEVFVARTTPYCVQEVNNWVEKTLSYERTPQLLDSISLWFYDNLFPIGDAYTTYPEYFTHQFILMNDAQECVRRLSESYTFNNIHLFGWRTVFCDYYQTYNFHAYWPSSPSQQHAGLNHLGNYNKYIFSSSLASFNGGYDSHLIETFNYTLEPSDTCIIDGFVDAYNSIGACAFFGYTRLNLVSYSIDLEHEFYECLFSPYTGSYPPEPACTRLGVAEALSKCGDRINWLNKWYRYVCYSHNYFGSPYTEAWTNQPRNFSVNHPRQVYVGIPIQFRVTVRDALTGTSVAYAKVCLHKPNDIYKMGYSDANGQITFTITPQTTGTIRVTVTRIHDNNTYIQYFPSQTTCMVLEPPGGSQSSDSNEILPTTPCILHLSTIIRSSITIIYGTPEQGALSIDIYDATGSKVKTIMHPDLSPGCHRESVDAKGLASGVYFVVLKQNKGQASKKFLLIR